jgi:hypothetical protein
MVVNTHVRPEVFLNCFVFLQRNGGKRPNRKLRKAKAGCGKNYCNTVINLELPALNNASILPAGWAASQQAKQLH